MPPPRRAPKPATPPTELQHQSVQEGQPPSPPSLPPATEAQFSWVPLADVKKWDKNPRDNRAAIPKVAASIRRFGVVSAPVVWTSRGRLVAGHTRIAALESLLAEDPAFVPAGAPPGTSPGYVPIRFHEFLTEEEATAYAIADNRLGELAQWDVAALSDLLSGIEAPLVELAGFEVPSLDGSFVPVPGSLNGPKTDPAAEWASAGMPSMEAEDRNGYRTLLVHFVSEEALCAFVALVGVSVTEKTRYIWYPPQDPKDPTREVGRFSDRHYERGE